MAKARVSFKIAKDVHAELSKLAEENGYGLLEFAEVLLEYATRDLNRVDEALVERRARGGRASQKRREGGDVPDWAVEKNERDEG